MKNKYQTLDIHIINLQIEKGYAASGKTKEAFSSKKGDWGGGN